MEAETKRPAAIWVIFIVSVLSLISLVLGQTMAFINYEFAESIGLQESETVIGRVGVATNKGFGVGDTIIYIPLLFGGLIGLWQRKIWGVFMMIGAMAITAYWPMVSLFMLVFARDVAGFEAINLASYGVLLVAITLYGVWGLWYLYTRREALT